MKRTSFLITVFLAAIMITLSVPLSAGVPGSPDSQPQLTGAILPVIVPVTMAMDEAIVCMMPAVITAPPVLPENTGYIIDNGNETAGCNSILLTAVRQRDGPLRLDRIWTLRPREQRRKVI